MPLAGLIGSLYALQKGRDYRQPLSPFGYMQPPAFNSISRDIRQCCTQKNVVSVEAVTLTSSLSSV